MVCSSQGLPAELSIPEPSSGDPPRSAGTETGSWLGTGAARTRTGAPAECQRHRWRLNPPHCSASSISLGLKSHQDSALATPRLPLGLIPGQTLYLVRRVSPCESLGHTHHSRVLWGQLALRWLARPARVPVQCPACERGDFVQSHAHAVRPRHGWRSCHPCSAHSRAHRECSCP